MTPPQNNMVNYARLYVHVKGGEDSPLYHKYIQHVENHNNSIINNRYPNAGFDVYFPDGHAFPSGKTEFVSMDIQCEMHVYDGVTNSWKPVSYYSYPRSSISKTPLILANSVGIIDSGYRGNLIGAFKNTSLQDHLVEQHARLLQICAPNLQPIHVTLVDTSFFEQTARGDGGFGSTGI
jgi:dUTP pyrophosphatase